MSPDGSREQVSRRSRSAADRTATNASRGRPLTPRTGPKVRWPARAGRLAQAGLLALLVILALTYTLARFSPERFLRLTTVFRSLPVAVVLVVLAAAALWFTLDAARAVITSVLSPSDPDRARHLLLVGTTYLWLVATIGAAVWTLVPAATATFGSVATAAAGGVRRTQTTQRGRRVTDSPLTPGTPAARALRTRAITGLVVGVLTCGHLIGVPLLGQGLQALDWNVLAARWSSIVWRGWDLALAIAVLAHLVAALRSRAPALGATGWAVRLVPTVAVAAAAGTAVVTLGASLR